MALTESLMDRGLPDPGADALAHGRRVDAHIRAVMEAAGGSIGFDQFMELALYAPGLGYYSAGSLKFGSQGDFVTAPETSALFGRCVARQCAEVLAETSGDILELGAGSGALAADILLELEQRGNLPQRYLISEVSADLRERQQQTLQRRVPHLLPRIHWLDTLDDVRIDGVILANEVMDALPVCCFRIDDNGLSERRVTWHDGGFVWAPVETGQALHGQSALCRQTLNGLVDAGLVDGLGAGGGRYESEVCPALSPWIATLAGVLQRGMLLLIDYGYPRDDYYHPQRSSGTLMCHFRHHAHADPLILAGLQDITAHVDFTAVAEAGAAAGLDVAGYTSQTWFLLGCGLEQMLAGSDPDDVSRHLQLANEAKTLTLPEAMGERFKAMALSRGLATGLCGFSLRDLRARL